MCVAVDFPLAQLLDEYAEQSARYRELVARNDLDTKAKRACRDGLHVGLSWVLLHLTEETARHNGHMDILREMLDGTIDAQSPSARRSARGMGADRAGAGAETCAERVSMGESSPTEHDQWPKRWRAGSPTWGRAVDQRCDLRLSCRWSSSSALPQPQDGPDGRLTMPLSL